MPSLSHHHSLRNFRLGIPTALLRGKEPKRALVLSGTLGLDVQMEDSVEVKQFELQRAIEKLDRKLARKLILDDGVKPTAIEATHLLRFLRVAVSSRDPSLVGELLQQKPNLKCSEGGQILWIVVDDGDTEIATMLVQAGADLDEPHRGSSFLHVLLASVNPRKHRLALLMIELGANVNAHDAKTHSVLYYAVKRQLTEVVVELLRRGAIVEEEVVTSAAVTRRAAELLPMLVGSHGADETTTRDRQAINAIMRLVVQGDCVDAVKAVLDVGVAVDHVNTCGWTSLVFATIFERVRVVELLLNCGADVTKKSDNGILPLYAASGLAESTIAQMLIRRGANIHEANKKDRQYPIHAACASESLPNIHLLLNLGANISVVDRSGRSPFSLMDTAESLNYPIKHVIKHLALMDSKGVTIHDMDLTIINESVHTQTFYEDCLKELDKMKIVKIYNNISFFAVFEKNMQELSSLIRNPDFVKSFNNSPRKSWFPIYFADMSIKFRNSEKRKNILVFKENILKKVWPTSLPDVVIRRIAYYLCLNDLQSV